MVKFEQAREVRVGRIRRSDSAVKALNKLNQDNVELLLLITGKEISGLITRRSALKALSGSRLDELKAADLAEPDAPPVTTTMTLPEMLAAIKEKEPRLLANSEGLVIGAISNASLMRYLGQKYTALEREVDAIINFSPDWIFVTDGNGIALRANRYFYRDYGLTMEEVLGKSVTVLEEKRVFYPSVTRMVLQHKSPQTIIQSQKDGRKLLASGVPVFNEDGSIFRVVVNVRDITRLNKLKQQLEEAERLKDLYYQKLIDLNQGYEGNHKLLVSSPRMAALVSTAQKIAQVDSTIMITGETGVGKGVIARYIHDCSPRRNNPFVTVNCGSIPENLLESELFGYVKGAFTGARSQGKLGKMELANKGTLFLDEITELPLNHQVKLLQVIQEGIINRIGDIKEIHLDLRIITASNRDVAELVRQGKFREDLYFRLNVFPLEVPPLRERVEDIKPLADYFLEKFNRKYHLEKYFDEAVYEHLCRYQWPGNVRELENLIERLVVVAETDAIEVRHLPDYIAQTKTKTGATEDCLLSLPLQPLEQAKENLEKSLFSQALQECRSTYEIARILKVNQSTVVRKLKKYGLQKDKE